MTKPPRGSYLSVLLRPKANAVEDDLRNYTMEYRRFPLRTQLAELPCGEHARSSIDREGLPMDDDVTTIRRIVRSRPPCVTTMARPADGSPHRYMVTVHVAASLVTMVTDHVRPRRVDQLGQHEALALGLRHRSAQVPRPVDPELNRILDVPERGLLIVYVRHALGQLGHIEFTGTEP